MRMWSVHLQQKELDQLVWNLGVHVRNDCKEWLEEPVITNASNLCSASRWNLMTLNVRWIALQNRSLCIDQLLQGSPRMLCRISSIYICWWSSCSCAHCGEFKLRLVGWSFFVCRLVKLGRLLHIAMHWLVKLGRLLWAGWLAGWSSLVGYCRCT